MIKAALDERGGGRSSLYCKTYHSIGPPIINLCSNPSSRRFTWHLRSPLLISVAPQRFFAADYQWSVSIAGVINQTLTSSDAKPGSIDPDYPRAFLWIPPNCKQVKAIILSQNNMEEESILEDATFRKTLSDLGFAEIWVTPNMGSIHFPVRPRGRQDFG